ncbi:MAG: FkbM family methyltransferase [Kiritimatiellae bacterium]|nr:FkbM family methyltransferase [Kiritimatiellia bacterium]
MTLIVNHNLSPQHTIPIGSLCEFHLEKELPAESECCIRHASILYLKPLPHPAAERILRFFPEAPGRYSLLLLSPAGAEGGAIREEFPFEVLAKEASFDGPQRLKTYNRNNLLVPNAWDAKNFSSFEKPVWSAIKEQVKPGWVAYDIGANMGIYSTAFSQLVGPAGRVYCFEANPMCLYFLQTNLAHEKCAENCEIIPEAIHDHTGECAFSINYANTGIGMTATNSMYGGKIGHEIKVHCSDLDALATRLALRPPQFIKIDIEGAEGAAILGMKNILQKEHPILLVEVHGIEPARVVFPALDTCHYAYQEVNGRTRFNSAQEVLDWFPDNVFQFLCT